MSDNTSDLPLVPATFAATHPIYLRAHTLGIGESRVELKDMRGYKGPYDCDVFINGGNMGAIFADCACSVMGYTFVVIEQHPYHIGGMTTGGLSFSDNADSPTGLAPFARIFYQSLADYYGLTLSVFMNSTNRCNATPGIFMQKLKEMMVTYGVTVQNGICVEKAEKIGSGLNQFLTNISLSDGSVVWAKQYIDATYEGDLILRAGVSYTFGRESNSKLGETYNGATALTDIIVGKPIDAYVTPATPSSGLLPNVQPNVVAPGFGDKRVQGYCYRLCMTTAADRITPPEPTAYNALDYEYLGRLFAAGAGSGAGFIFTIKALQGGIKFDFNANGAVGTNVFGETYQFPFMDYASRIKFQLRVKNYILGLFKFIREDSRVDAATKTAVAAYGFAADEFGESDGFSPALYVRESIRLDSDYIWTEPDLTNNSISDGIVYGAYALDSHYVSLVNVGGIMKKEGNVFQNLGYYYKIPYRALLPKISECRNLISAYCISASHSTFGSARLEWMGMAFGEAAGYAACLAIQQKRTLHELHPSFVQAKVNVNPPGVVMHALQMPNASGRVVTVGAWTTAQNSVGREVWGQSFAHDNAAGKGTKSKQFFPILPGAGVYEIWCKVKDVNDASRANNVPVTVKHSGGTTAVVLNQKLPGAGINTFTSLGQFTLVGDGSDYVLFETTGTSAGTLVVVDAVVFEPKFDIFPTLLDSQANDMKVFDKTITVAQLLALNATPVQIVPTPGAGFANVLLGIMISKASGVAYAGIAAGKDLAVKYTDGAGAILAEIESTGFLDQTTAQVRYGYPFLAGATSPVFSTAPVANAALVLQMLVGEIITGDSELKIRTWVRIIPTTL